MKNILFITYLFFSLSSWSQNKVALDFFNKGTQKSESGKSAESIIEFTKALKEEPFFTGAYLSRALEKIKIKDLTGAMSDANAAITIESKNADAFTTRANIYYKLKDYQNTIKDCTMAISLNPNDYVSYNLRGLSYKNSNDLKNACLDFNKAIQLGSKSAVNNKKIFCK